MRAEFGQVIRAVHKLCRRPKGGGAGLENADNG